MTDPAPERAEPPPPAPDPCAAEIDILIRSRYPLIHILSWEEDRVMRQLDAIGARLAKRIIQWTVNSGLTRWRPGVFGTAEGIKGTKDPVTALKEIEAHKSEPTIFVLKDFHRYMEEAAVVRALRDLTFSLKDTYSTLVLLGPSLMVPRELEKEMAIVDFPLPTRGDLDQLFDTLVKEAEENEDLKIDGSADSRRQLVDAALGLTLAEAENVFAKILLSHGVLSGGQAADVHREKRKIIRTSGLLEYIDTPETIDSIGGMGALKEWLRKRRRAFEPAARAFGLPIPKGVFMVGVQGCGKSLCAKATSAYWGMPILRLDLGALFGSYHGQSEENVRRAIRLAEAVAPVILWIDEIDKGVATEGNGSDGTAARVFSTLLTWLQEKTSHVFVIATANQVEKLPPELMRQGRFDEIFFVDLPSAAERALIFGIHLRKHRRDPARFDLNDLAARTDGFSGAEIEQAIISAMYDAFDENRDIDQDLLASAIARTFPLSRIMAEEITRRRRWAEGRTRRAS